MSRAFEIEHTTAIYSGLLRMADLLSLQPNMDINLHIVARNQQAALRVFREIAYDQHSRVWSEALCTLSAHFFHMTR